ncbi:MAG TPA: hypothetical protein VFA04_03590 [Bryobacteraceae bacterium]|nr:hypothetical protein [Bryobacteraceae bacterium]
MRKNILLCALAAAGLASAETYHVKLLDPTVVNGTELKAGEYKVDVADNKAVFHAGKKTVEAPVKVETAGGKFAATTLRYGAGADGKMTLQAIQLGGSRTRLVFGSAGSEIGSSAP